MNRNRLIDILYCLWVFSVFLTLTFVLAFTIILITSAGEDIRDMKIEAAERVIVRHPGMEDMWLIKEGERFETPEGAEVELHGDFAIIHEEWKR